MFGFKATFDLGSAGIPASAESQTALKTLEKGLPPGATDPAVVLLHARSGPPLGPADLSAYQAKLKSLPDVGAVSPPQVSADKATAAYTVTLTLDPTSTTAVHAVEGPIRTGAHAAAPAGTYALVGGTTSVFADIQKAVNHDYALVFPVAAAVILVMLGLMLRSLVAPARLPGPGRSCPRRAGKPRASPPGSTAATDEGCIRPGSPRSAR